MGLNDILKKINSQGEAEAYKIIEESRNKAKQIKTNAEQEAFKEADIYLVEEQRRAEMEATRILTQARLDKRMKILFFKKEIINRVMDKAFEQAVKGEQTLKKQVIMKDGEKQSVLDREKVKDELRPVIEGLIAEDLKL
jgi:vacuolar-type H+-ATPase subunit H